jgi:hypothetical protein
MGGKLTLAIECYRAAMNDGYEPASNFLVWVLNEEAPLTGSEQADVNLDRVIPLTADDDASNRDWATFILGNCDLDTPAIRAALTARADDPVERVRAEAIRGLARKDRSFALPYVQRALDSKFATVNVFEAAAIVAHPSLIEQLSRFAKSTDDEQMDQLVRDALIACQCGKPDERYC